MRTIADHPRQRWTAALAVSMLIICGGCAYTPNYFKETGPSTQMSWDSPTSADVKARFASADQRQRDWPQCEIATEDGAVMHWPLYFEDPFLSKGHGRTDATHPQNVYHCGWEDYVAFPYCFARFTANWLLLPVSAVVTPPWTPMESDGQLGRRILFEEHDAEATVPWPGCAWKSSDDVDEESGDSTPPTDTAPAQEAADTSTATIA